MDAFRPTKLHEQVEKAETTLRERGYADKTIESYVGVWQHLMKYAAMTSMASCTAELLTRFAEQQYGIKDIFHPIDDREKYYAGILLRLHDVSSSIAWITKRSYREPKQLRSRSFSAAYDNYSDWLERKNLRKSSIALKQHLIRGFMEFAEAENIVSLSALSQTVVLKYLESKVCLSKPTIDSIVITLRDFFRHPVVLDMIGKDLSVNLKVSKSSRYRKLPSFFSIDELRSILAVIDRSTLEGKKDFAVILLAVDTGLRISDIINLRFSSLKWDQQEIEVVQLKTGEFLRLAMTGTLKWALLDYIMNSRPKTKAFDHVFLRSVAPFCPYISAGHYYNRLNKYFTLAGVDTNGKHHGMHALRHSLAARLLGNNVPITIISETLGHRYANVTMQYVRIDIEKLRLAALEVPPRA